MFVHENAQFSSIFTWTSRVISYLVSWHLCTWVHFFSEMRILYLRPFPKWNLLFLFTQIYRVWLIKRNFRTITWIVLSCDFKTTLISWEIWKPMPLNVSIAYIQLHIYGVSEMVGLFGSSEYRCTWEAKSTKQFKSAYKEVQMVWLHQKKNVFISVLHLSTLSGRFRVVCLVLGIFQHDRAFIFSNGPWIFDFWTAAIHSWSNLIKTQQYVPIWK